MNQKVEQSSSVHYNIGTSTYSSTRILAIHHHLMPVNSFTTEWRSVEKGEKRDKYECECSQTRQCRPNFLAHGCDWFTCLRHVYRANLYTIAPPLRPAQLKTKEQTCHFLFIYHTHLTDGCCRDHRFCVERCFSPRFRSLSRCR